MTDEPKLDEDDLGEDPPRSLLSGGGGCGPSGY